MINTDCTLTARAIIRRYLNRWEVENFYRVAKQSLSWGDYQMRELFAIERHVQLMMVAHAYLEIGRQELLAAPSDLELHVTLGDIQRQHQSLTRRAQVAQVFHLAQHGFELETIHQQLAV